MSRRGQALIDRERLLVDFETSGLVEEPWAEPLELGAAVLGVDGRLTGEHFTSLIRPSALDARASRALAVNRIPVDELLVAPTPADVSAAFTAWWLALGRPMEWRAWNAPFDQHFLRVMGIALPTGQRRLVCSMGWASDVLYRPSGMVGLDAAAYELRVACPESLARHRALGDAQLAALVEAALARREQHQHAGRLGRAEARRLLTFVKHGRAAWKAGITLEGNPHVAVSAEGRAWARGWDQAARWAREAATRAAEQERAQALATALSARPHDQSAYTEPHALVTLRGGELDEAHLLRVSEGVWKLLDARTWAELTAGPFDAEAPVEALVGSVCASVRTMMSIRRENHTAAPAARSST